MTSRKNSILTMNGCNDLMTMSKSKCDDAIEGARLKRTDAKKPPELTKKCRFSSCKLLIRTVEVFSNNKSNDYKSTFAILVV